MSGNSVEIARQRLKPRRGTSRQGVEQVLLRFPSFLAFATRRLDRLPPGSRLRKAVFRRALVTGVQALNRGRPERAFSVYHPTDSVLVVGERFLGLAMEEPRGREGRIDFQRAWNAEWGEFRFEIEEVIDFGDHRILVVGRIEGTGRASGAAFDGEWAAMLTFADGWIVKEEAFFDHAEALKAAGLSE